MADYLFKTYILDGREYFVYGDKEKELTRQDFLFPQSLLLLLDLNVMEIDKLAHPIDRLIERYCQTREDEIASQILAGLEELAKMHIFFEFLLLDWRRCFERARDEDTRHISDVLPHKQIGRLYSEIQERQRQIKTLFHEVLDANKERGQIPERMMNYYQRKPRRSLDRYCFEPRPMCYEVVEQGVFADVLRPSSVYDLIDFSVSECVKRRLRMRVCENCGRWFAITGRITANYCNLPLDGKRGRSCREVAAMKKWTENKKENEIFQEYRREYKRRFAWIRAGHITSEEFYRWSEQARLREADCERGETSFEEFKIWLRNS